MKSIKGTLTEQNLLKAFAGESQARNRYYLFSQTAKLEGYEEIAGVFFETAEQEREHAKRFFDFMEGGMVSITAEYPAGKVGTTAENLLEAAEGELLEWSALYTDSAGIALDEGFKDISVAFQPYFSQESRLFLSVLWPEWRKTRLLPLRCGAYGRIPRRWPRRSARRQ